MQTPWSHLKRSLTAEEWVGLNAWLIANEDKRTPFGTVREDGRIFRRYCASYAGGEIWETEATRLKRIALSKYNSSKPEVKARRNAAQRLRYANDSAYRARVKEWSATTQKKNHERINKRARERRKTDPAFRARIAESNKKWVAKNRDFFNAQVKRRRAIRKGQSHPHALHGNIAAYYALARRLTNETGIRHEVDHIIPLSLGGFHHQDNIQVIPESVNRSKLYNPFWTTDTYLDWRDVPRRLWPIGLKENYAQRLGSKRWVRRFSSLSIYGDNRPPVVEYVR